MTATLVLAPNPGPMTLDGTNTWILSVPGGRHAVVVDPGPLHEGHLAAVRDTAGEAGLVVTTVLLTHGHLDHSEGARRFSELTGAPVRALDPTHTLGGEGLRDGDVVTAGDLAVEVVATPGHTADSLSFWSPADAAVLTGDTVLGRGTSVVAHPDGRLGDYLSSLELLERLVATVGAERLLPGHGPLLEAPDAPPAEVLRGYLRHRVERLDQVRRAVADGAVTAADVVAVVYADVPREVWPAAELSVLAQMAYLGGDPPRDR